MSWSSLTDREVSARPRAGAAGPGATSVLAVVPDAAEELFAGRLPVALRFAEWLAGAGTTRGVVGPREAERLWDRHLLNCALVAALVPAGAHVADVGSGGGLPGVVVALARPDVRVTLIDSMARRTAFLSEVVADLGLEQQVAVRRARAEGLALNADAATSRAVADLGTVASWSAGLVRTGGILLAMRGGSAHAELAGHARRIRSAGWQDAEVVERSCAGVTPCLVVRATMSAGAQRRGPR